MFSELSSYYISPHAAATAVEMFKATVLLMPQEQWQATGSYFILKCTLFKSRYTLNTLTYMTSFIMNC